MDIDHYAGSLEAGQDLVFAAAATFGLDQRTYQQGYTEANRPPAAGVVDNTVKSLWPSSRLGYLEISAQARHDRPDEALRSAGQTVVHFLLTW